MIRFQDVTKNYRSHLGEKIILHKASFEFIRGQNVGILGGNGAGKSTLLRLVSGAEAPDSGRVFRDARVSFPLGFAGTFHPDLTGRQNAKFLARIYGENVRRVVEFVGDFAELGMYYDLAFSTYSSGMMSKLAFGVSLAIDFDVYLIDEITEVGDARFREKSAAYFRDRMARSDIIMVSHNSHTIRNYCDVGAVLLDGRLEFFDSIDEAMRVYRASMGSLDA